MKNNYLSYILVLVLMVCAQSAGGALRITSGEASLEALPSGKEFTLALTAAGRQTGWAGGTGPVLMQVNGKLLSAAYSSCKPKGDALLCRATVTTPNGSLFAFSDTYRPAGEERFLLERKVEVTKAVPRDLFFNTFFGFDAGGESGFGTYEFFVPGVWYKSNFTPEGNIPDKVPQLSDTCFLYRSDRIALPVVMLRDPADGAVLSITQMGSVPSTVMADGRAVRDDTGYQFGSVGVKKQNGRTLTLFAYPGTEEFRRGGAGERSHPVREYVKHGYSLEFAVSSAPDYPSAVEKVWNRAFGLYRPEVRMTDLNRVYEGLIETLLTYYVPSVGMGGVYDQPGFPFQVGLDDFKARGIDYQMGFVGMQVATGYYLFRDGTERKDGLTAKKGEAVLDFWAAQSLTSQGYPRSWYDPGKEGKKGTFRRYSNLRTVTGGMESLLEAWCFARRNKVFRPAWIDACRRFGHWMLANQNPDGSWFFSYDHTKTVDGKHPATMENKYLTVCGIRYLVELYTATGNEAFRKAALRAGEFCLRNIHDKYAYVACVVDNPQTIDSESGQMALNGFLSLYDLTGETQWLRAAEQAATYAETWTYMQDIPVEEDCSVPLVIPQERSMVGQHLIAVGQSAADLGFAWNSFNYYRLWLFTGKEHYLHVARIAAHNTKQTMNWDGTLYPGQPRGLQLEAFRVTVPRRQRGVLTTLNWNYAAHLDPMIRFKDAFGTPDIEQAEKLPLAERQRLNALYAKTQSAESKIPE